MLIFSWDVMVHTAKRSWAHLKDGRAAGKSLSMTPFRKLNSPRHATIAIKRRKNQKHKQNIWKSDNGRTIRLQHSDRLANDVGILSIFSSIFLFISSKLKLQIMCICHSFQQLITNYKYIGVLARAHNAYFSQIDWTCFNL